MKVYTILLNGGMGDTFSIQCGDAITKALEVQVSWL